MIQVPELKLILILTGVAFLCLVSLQYFYFICRDFWRPSFLAILPQSVKYYLQFPIWLVMDQFLHVKLIVRVP